MYLWMINDDKYLSFSGPFFCLLTYNVPSSPYTFSVSDLESVISPGTICSFLRWLVFWNQDLGTSMFISSGRYFFWAPWVSRARDVCIFRIMNWCWQLYFKFTPQGSSLSSAFSVCTFLLPQWEHWILKSPIIYALGLFWNQWNIVLRINNKP